MRELAAGGAAGSAGGAVMGGRAGAPQGGVGSHWIAASQSPMPGAAGRQVVALGYAAAARERGAGRPEIACRQGAYEPAPGAAVLGTN